MAHGDLDVPLGFLRAASLIIMGLIPYDGLDGHQEDKGE